MIVVESLSCVQFFCNPMNSSPPGSSIHGICQARILEWVAISFSIDRVHQRLKNGRLDLRKFYIQKGSMVSTCLTCISSYYSAYEDIKNIIRFFFSFLNKMSVSFSTKESESESCSVVYDSLWPHGLVHRILQARILEWVAFPVSRESSQPRDRTQVSRIAWGFFTSWVARKTLSTKLLALKNQYLELP